MGSETNCQSSWPWTRKSLVIAILHVQPQPKRRVAEQQEVLQPTLGRRGRGHRGDHGGSSQQTGGRPQEVLLHRSRLRDSLSLHLKSSGSPQEVLLHRSRLVDGLSLHMSSVVSDKHDSHPAGWLG